MRSIVLFHFFISAANTPQRPLTSMMTSLLSAIRSRHRRMWWWPSEARHFTLYTAISLTRLYLITHTQISDTASCNTSNNNSGTLKGWTKRSSQPQWWHSQWRLPQVYATIYSAAENRPQILPLPATYRPLCVRDLRSRLIWTVCLSRMSKIAEAVEAKHIDDCYCKQ